MVRSSTPVIRIYLYILPTEYLMQTHIHNTLFLVCFFDDTSALPINSLPMPFKVISRQLLNMVIHLHELSCAHSYHLILLMNLNICGQRHVSLMLMLWVSFIPMIKKMVYVCWKQMDCNPFSGPLFGLLIYPLHTCVVLHFDTDTSSLHLIFLLIT